MQLLLSNEIQVKPEAFLLQFINLGLEKINKVFLVPLSGTSSLRLGIGKSPQLSVTAVDANISSGTYDLLLFSFPILG